MGRYCPKLKSETVYLTCQECDEKTCEDMTFYCVVVGSRSFDDYSLLSRKLDILLSKQKDICIVSGGARGADALAKRYAEEKGYRYKEFPADWNKYGRSAGMIRNREMLDFAANHPKNGMAAFWDGKSPGTKNDIQIAKEKKMQTSIIIFQR